MFLANVPTPSIHFSPTPQQKHSLDSVTMTQTTSSSEKQTYTVYRQPIAVDRLCLYDVSIPEASGIVLIYVQNIY
jgi:hypothetical protein